jgi:hypothetical protein
MNSLSLDHYARSNVLRLQNGENRNEARPSIRHCSHHNRRVAYEPMENIQELGSGTGGIEDEM